MKKIATLIALLTTFAAIAADIVIYPSGIVTGTGPDCAGGTCAGRASYAKTIANGWGWAPDTNGNTVFTATYTNSTTIHLQAGGKKGDTYCMPTNSVQIPNPPYSTVYRFTVYYPTAADIPSGTNQAGLVIHNFNP